MLGAGTIFHHLRMLNWHKKCQLSASTGPFLKVINDIPVVSLTGGGASIKSTVGAGGAGTPKGHAATGAADMGNHISPSILFVFLSLAPSFSLSVRQDVLRRTTPGSRLDPGRAIEINHFLRIACFACVARLPARQISAKRSRRKAEGLTAQKEEEKQASSSLEAFL